MSEQGLSPDQLGVASVLVVACFTAIGFLARWVRQLVKDNREDALAYLRATTESTQVLKQAMEFFAADSRRRGGGL